MGFDPKHERECDRAPRGGQEEGADGKKVEIQRDACCHLGKGEGLINYSIN